MQYDVMEQGGDKQCIFSAILSSGKNYELLDVWEYKDIDKPSSVWYQGVHSGEHAKSRIWSADWIFIQERKDDTLTDYAVKFNRESKQPESVELFDDYEMHLSTYLKMKDGNVVILPVQIYEM